MNGNVRQDMLRQGGIPQPPNILGGMGNPPFMQNSSQSNQQLLGPNPMGLSPNTSNPNAPMGMMPTGPMNPMLASPPSQRYMVSQGSFPPSQNQRPVFMRPSQSNQTLNPNMPSVSNAHMPQNHIQGMGFTSNMMSQQQAGNVNNRRVSSQSQPNPSNHQGNIPPGVPTNMGMSSLPSHIRPNHQHTLRLQQPPISGMSPEMSVSRHGANMGMSSSMGRSGSAPSQVMNSLTQPPSLPQGSHPSGLPPSHQNIQNSVPLPAQHSTPQLSSSPRPGSLPPNHPQGMSTTTPGPSHTPVLPNRSRLSPENPNTMSFVGFPGSQFQPGNASRMPSSSGQYYVPSSPPISMPDMSPGLMNNTGGNSGRPNFHPTPAQQYEQMQGPESFPNHFGMPPPIGSTRPSSQHNQSTQQSPPHTSPIPSEAMNSQPPRPLSQPHIGRPPSQGGRAPTPRSSQPSLPPNTPLAASGRIIQPALPNTVQHLPIAPRPPHPPSTGPAPPNTGRSSQTPGNTPPTANVPIPRSQPNIATYALGSGQGLIRLLQFSGILSSESKQKLQLSWWYELVKEYFTPKAVMRFTLWKDNQQNEAKPFEIGVPILPRFFLVTTQSGVKSMTLSLDGARERVCGPGIAIVECVAAVWTYKYNNGYTVTLRGPLTAHVVITSPHPPGATPSTQTSPQPYLLKFEEFHFDANFHDKYIALESISIMGPRLLESPRTPRTRNAPTPTPSGNGGHSHHQQDEDKKWDEPRVIIERGSLPGEPVNAFGIPQATMRCLELAESVGAMADLITYANDTQLGPLDALVKFAARIRDSQVTNPGPPSMVNGLNHSQNTYIYPPGEMISSPAVTLYSSAPPSVTNPTSNPPLSQAGSSPQNASSSAANSPQKQHKTIPQSSQGSASTSVTAASPAVSGGTATPSLSNATLKRKQSSDTTSPITASSDQPVTKRPTRKRRGQGGA